MLSKVKMPRVGENVSTVFIVEFSVRVGDVVNEGDPIVSVETDKATVEVPSPIAGKIVEFLVTIDQEVSVGDPLVVLETN
jgi:pyruvate/2-oxoglutarate dehydrogenase complex dihydrolipoamide acyltransferase (E2) component